VVKAGQILLWLLRIVNLRSQPLQERQGRHPNQDGDERVPRKPGREDGNQACDQARIRHVNKKAAVAK